MFGINNKKSYILPYIFSKIPDKNRKVKISCCTNLVRREAYYER